MANNVKLKYLCNKYNYIIKCLFTDVVCLDSPGPIELIETQRLAIPEPLAKELS